MEGKKKPGFWESISCFIVMILVIGIGKGVMNWAIQPLLLVCALYAALLGLKLGYNYAEMEEGVTENLTASLPILYILMSVGIVIGTWIFSGTVPMLIYYGLQLISPQFFCVTAFLITAVVSTATGTAWGSIATAGMALIGVAAGMNIPLGMAAGAIISGGVFGDKMSPLSDTTNLSPLICGVNLFDHIRHMFYTTIPASLVGLAVWFVAGLRLEGIGTDVSTGLLAEQLSTIYHWHILLLLPAVIIIVGAIMKKPTVPLMLLSSVVALGLGVFFNGFGIKDGIDAMYSGFKVSMILDPLAAEAAANGTVQSLLNRGGIMSMMSILITIFCGYAFAGIVAKIGCLRAILEVFAEKIDNVPKLIGATILGSILLVATAGVASISIIMIGFLLKDMYEDMDLHPKNLSRTLEDAGTMLLPFVPWGASGLYYVQMLGVSVGEYAIWCIPCYLCVVFAMIWAFTGFGIAKLTPEEKEHYLKIRAEA